MVRAGRKRKEGEARYPCGKIDLREDPRATEPAEFRNMQEAVKKMVLNPIWTCELWRLSHFDKINQLQREAGDQWIKLVERHRRYITGAPAPSAKVSKMERGYGPEGESDIESLPEQEKLDKLRELRKIEDAWDAAYCAVIDRSQGVAIMRAVNSICLEDEPATYSTILLAKQGLDILARHFGLDRPKNKA